MEKAERNARLTVGEDKVFGDDFADVDLREELCYHSRPKKEKFGGGLLRFIDFLESVFYGGGAVTDFTVSAKILMILQCCCCIFADNMIY